MLRILLLILLAHSAFSQVHNPEFEEWESSFGLETPKDWYCPNLCYFPVCSPCAKIEQKEHDFAVRIQNVMPCVSSDNQAKSRNAGFIRDYFIYANPKFKISYDLIIDSIEAPAEFTFTIHNFVWKTDSIQSTRVEHEINLAHVPDSIFIQFESKGGLKQNALHDCDLGYLSAIVDSIQISEIVNVHEVLQPHIMAYPNPFVDKIQIDETIEVVIWRIFDIHGKQILHGNSNTIIGLEDISCGIYTLLAGDATQSYVKKIVKYCR